LRIFRYGEFLPRFLEALKMTAAMSEYLPHADGWTVDDLDALPEDGVRRELLDGVLLVSPPPRTFIK
jgi:hypothetical protein